MTDHLARFDRGVSGIQSSEKIIMRKEADYIRLSDVYKLKENSNEINFDPLYDGKVGKCFSFLYQKNDYETKEWTMEDGLEMVNRGEISVGGLVYAAWLNTLLTVTGGSLDQRDFNALLDEMIKKGEKVLNPDKKSESDLSIASLKSVFMAPGSPLTPEAAISLGSIQMLELLNSEKAFEGQEERYREMFRASIPRPKESFAI